LTGNVLIDLAISLAGIAILIGLARIIFGASLPSLDAANAAERLLFDEPDFHPIDWLVDEDSGAALARNGSGEIALVVAHGDGLVTRRYPAGAAPLAYEDGRLCIARTDHTFRNVNIAAGVADAASWLDAAGARST
jgi:hypothetical protein